MPNKENTHANYSDRHAKNMLLEKARIGQKQIFTYNARNIFSALLSERIETVYVDIDGTENGRTELEVIYYDGTKQIIDESNKNLTKIAFKIENKLHGDQSTGLVGTEEATDILTWAQAITLLSKTVFKEQMLKNDIEHEAAIRISLIYSTADRSVETDFTYLNYSKPEIESVEDVYEFKSNAETLGLEVFAPEE